MMSEPRPPELRADCKRCAALCCLLLAIDKGPKFAIDKPAGTPCPNLAGHGCKIHDQLEAKGFSGCVQYDCLGAGQIVVQEIFGGESWRDRPELAAPMAEAFRLLREVQETRQDLIAAQKLSAAPKIAAACAALEAKLTPDWQLTRPQDFDLAGVRAEYQQLLTQLRAELTPPGATQAPLYPSPRRQ